MNSSSAQAGWNTVSNANVIPFNTDLSTGDEDILFQHIELKRLFSLRRLRTKIIHRRPDHRTIGSFREDKVFSLNGATIIESAPGVALVSTTGTAVLQTESSPNET